MYEKTDSQFIKYKLIPIQISGATVHGLIFLDYLPKQFFFRFGKVMIFVIIRTVPFRHTVCLQKRAMYDNTRIRWRVQLHTEW